MFVGDDNALNVNVSPIITLAIGDHDTGFNTKGDGITEYVSNGVVKYKMGDVYHTGNFDPNNYAILTGATFSGPVKVNNGELYLGGKILRIV